MKITNKSYTDEYGRNERDIKRGYRAIKRGNKSLGRYQKKFAKDEAFNLRKADRRAARMERKDNRQTRRSLKKQLRQGLPQTEVKSIKINPNANINGITPLTHRGEVGAVKETVRSRRGDPYEYKMENGKYFTRKRGVGNWIPVNTNTPAGQAVMKAVENGRTREAGGFGQNRPAVWKKDWEWNQEELDYQNKQSGGAIMQPYYAKGASMLGAKKGICKRCKKRECQCGGKMLKMAQGAKMLCETKLQATHLSHKLGFGGKVVSMGSKWAPSN